MLFTSLFFDGKLLFRQSLYDIISIVMGQITIEIPQKINRKYRIISESSAKEVLSKLELLVKKENEIGESEILGLWADRKESVEKIAQDLRKKTNDRRLRNE